MERVNFALAGARMSLDVNVKVRAQIPPDLVMNTVVMGKTVYASLVNSQVARAFRRLEPSI